MRKIGILHPGEMGVSVGASAVRNGAQLFWASEHRSDATRARAEKNHFLEVNSLAQVCQICDTILSVCPPHAAEDVAQSVIQAGFKGLYLDANAIAPQRSIELGRSMQEAGIRFVDGAIIGGPAWTSGKTGLYLSGDGAEEIAACFSNGLLETKIMGNEVGKASALKMCYAAYTKGTTALLAAILAAAESLRVRDSLYEQWNLDEPGFSEQVNQRVRRVTAKAWRFEGEMQEIAATFQEAGLPGGFHEAAAEIYGRMSGFKNAASTPALNEVIESLIQE